MFRWQECCYNMAPWKTPNVSKKKLVNIKSVKLFRNVRNQKRRLFEYCFALNLLVHKSNESRALQLITLVDEAGNKHEDAANLVSNGNAGNTNVSSSQQKENERSMANWEFRHKLLKRMKAGYHHASEYEL